MATKQQHDVEDAEFKTDDEVLAALSSSGSIGEAAAKIADAKFSKQEAAHDHFTRDMPASATLVSVPIDSLYESPTNPRKSFTGLDELAASLKKVGMLSPILVRLKRVEAPVTAEQGAMEYEIVFGHRRFRAAKLAGLTAVPVDVRPLTDVQVIEAQLIENVQRADIHPLEEAEGYQRLIGEAGYTAEMLASRLGRSRSWVYQRVKLLSLCAEARAAFLDGKISLSVAVPLARVPTPKLQAKAVDRIVGGHTEWSARNAIDWLQNEFCVPLTGAPFDKKDDMLIEGVPACTVCPKRSGCGPVGLFDDLGTKDVCTDTVCFDSKAKATWENRAEKFKKQGAEVLPLAAGKRLFRDGHLVYGSEYVEIDQPVHEDAKKRTWGQLLEDVEAPSVIVAPDASMKPHRLYLATAALDAAKKAGVSWAEKKAQKQAATTVTETSDADRLARDVRKKVALDVVVSAANSIRTAAKVQPIVYALLARAVEHANGGADAPAEFLARAKVKDFSKWAAKAEPPALLAYAFAALVHEWCGNTWEGFEEGLEQVAKAFGMNLQAMVADASAAMEREAKKSKAAEKAEALFKKEK